MKKTQWFPEDVKPIRIGAYETDLGRTAFDRYGYSWWNGSEWSNQFSTPERAEEVKWHRGIQDKPWRGLQGDGHSLKIGPSTYLVEFSEGPDRPGDDE